MVFRGVMVERGKRERGRGEVEKWRSGGEWGFVVQKRRCAQCAPEVHLSRVMRAIGNCSVRVERPMCPGVLCGGDRACRCFA